MPKPKKQRVAELTPRMRDVVRLSSLGCSLEQIAAIMGLSSRSTVDNHRNRAMQRLGTTNRALLTRAAIQHRISPLNDKLTRAEQRKLKAKPR